MTIERALRIFFTVHSYGEQLHGFNDMCSVIFHKYRHADLVGTQQRSMNTEMHELIVHTRCDAMRKLAIPVSQPVQKNAETAWITI